MRFATVSLALMAAATVTARVIPYNYARSMSLSGGTARNDAKIVNVVSDIQDAVKSSKSSSDKSSKNNSSSGVASNSTTSSSSSDNSTSTSSSSDNSTSSDNSSSATSTSTAAVAARTRPCDQGDQSLAAGLQAAVVIGIGMQASISTIQASNSSSDFSDGVTRLQQFLSTMDLQIQMAQGIADDGSFAQPQLALLADSQQSQTTAVAALSNSTSASDAATAQSLTDLLSSFLNTTNNAQDGVSNALIDCFLPTTAVSG